MKRSSLLTNSINWTRIMAQSVYFFHKTSTKKRFYSFYSFWKLWTRMLAGRQKIWVFHLKNNMQPTKMTFCIDFSLMMYIKKKKHLLLLLHLWTFLLLVILKGYCLRFTKKMVPSLMTLSHHFCKGYRFQSIR